MPQNIDYHAIAPELVLTGTILFLIGLEPFLRRDRKWLAMPIAMAGVLASLGTTVTLIGEHRVTFGGMYVVDSFGALIMPSSRDLLMLFIALELVSAPGFLMAAFRKTDPRSNEAGLKFFLIGVLSSAVMLYGMSLIYGVTGQTRLTGIAYKLGGLTGGTETMSFVAFLPRADFWTPMFAALSIATMTIGNLVALQQRQVVRLLAYSSIAQAGYMLLPFALVGATHAIDAKAFQAA